MNFQIVLLCLIGGISAAPNSVLPSNHYDSIVVGLGAAGVTAASTLAKAGQRVLGLEAEDRVGGRVHTVPFGDGIVELGAEWIHSDQGSRVYDSAINNNIVTIAQEDAFSDIYRSDGGSIDKALVEELQDVLAEIVGIPNAQPEPFGTYATRKIMEHITAHQPQVLRDQDFITEFLAFADLSVGGEVGCDSWYDVTTISKYEFLGGNQQRSWHRYGYKTFIELMLNTYNGGPGVTNLEIKLQTEVTSISVPQRPEERVVVHCRNGSSYEADSVIITVSLGVLKAKHSSLFSPPLPKAKQDAINNISMGVLGKIILSFNQLWWPSDMTFVAFIWRGEDKKMVGESWTTKVYLASRPLGSNNTVTLWISGKVARELESLSDDVVKSQSVELLQRFIGNTLNITIPHPTGMIRSNWHSNPYTRGSYSFDNTLTPQLPDARSWLGAPLTDSAGAPRVLFAGEATNVVHFATVHGASETGYQAAVRLLTASFVN